MSPQGGNRMIECGPQVLGCIGPPGPPAADRSASACGETARPSSAAAVRTPRSSATKASGSPRARMAMTPMVHGPMPAISARRAVGLVAVDVGIERPTRRRPTHRPAHAGCDGGARGSRRHASGASATASGVGKRWVSPPSGVSSGSPSCVDQAGGVAGGCSRRYLLAEDGPEGELGPVGRARDAAAWIACDHGSQSGIGSQVRVDGDRIGVEVEQPSTAGPPRQAGRAGRRAARVQSTWSSRGVSEATPEPWGKRSVRR